jgi:hypothetical protein
MFFSSPPPLGEGRLNRAIRKYQVIDGAQNGKLPISLWETRKKSRREGELGVVTAGIAVYVPNHTAKEKIGNLDVMCSWQLSSPPFSRG